MKIRKTQLKEVIRSILLEKEGDWLGDDEGEDLHALSARKISPEDYRARLNVAILKEKQDLAGKKQIDTEVLEKVLTILNTIHLAIDHEDDSHAYIRHIMFDQAGKPYSEDISGIEMDSQVRSAYEKHAPTNPIVVIVPSSFDKLSEREQKNTLEHEVNHIRNNYFKLYWPHLNIEEVQDVLRKDFKGKSIVEVIEILTSEGRFEKAKSGLEAASTKRLADQLYKYYQGVFAEPPDELAVDEFAVRVGKLQDYPDAVNNHQGSSFKDLEAKYSADAAQVLLFLDKNATLEDVNAVVKNSAKVSDSIKT